MNILLINPLVRKWALPNCFPTGLGYMASAFTGADHNVQVLDFNGDRKAAPLAFHFDCDRYITPPDIIGIGGIVTQYKEIKGIVVSCRSYWPNVPVVCGGPIAGSIPGLLLEKTEINVCVFGEGESQVENIICSSHAINKITIGPEEPIDISKRFLSWPSYSLFPMEEYIRNPIGPYNPNKWIDGKPQGDVPKSMNMIATRGCLYNCLFCYHNFQGQGYRKRSYNDVIMEMDFLGFQYEIEYIHFTDDAFVVDKKWVKDFCCAFKGRKMKWSCTGRANALDEDLVSTMADSGCIGIWVGLESGSDEILKRMDKKVTVEKYREVVPLLRKYFKYEDYTFIVGSLGETTRTVTQSIDFCKEMGITPSAIFYMTPYPGTPLFNLLMNDNRNFRRMVNDIDGQWGYEKWIEGLGEQGEHVAWDCSGTGEERLKEWKEKFFNETKKI